MIVAQQQDITLTRMQNKIDRLFGEWESYAKFRGADVDGVLRSLLRLRELSKEQFLDMGLLFYLKVLRLKVRAYQLVSDLKDMGFVDDTVMSIDAFYAEVERELAEQPPEPRTQVIPPLPAMDRAPEFDLTQVANKGLWQTIMGMLDSVGSDVPVDIPQELLSLTQVIDINRVQDEIVAMVRNEPTTIKALAQRFDFGKVTLAIVFLSCLFLDQERLVELTQGQGDVTVTVIPDCP
jgi:hypothetical protein